MTVMNITKTVVGNDAMTHYVPTSGLVRGVVIHAHSGATEGKGITIRDQLGQTIYSADGTLPTGRSFIYPKLQAKSFDGTNISNEYVWGIPVEGNLTITTSETSTSITHTISILVQQ